MRHRTPRYTPNERFAATQAIQKRQQQQQADARLAARNLLLALLPHQVLCAAEVGELLGLSRSSIDKITTGALLKIRNEMLKFDQAV